MPAPNQPREHPQAHPIRQVLKEPALGRYVASRFCRSLADTLLGASLAWHLFDVTGSAYVLGGLGVLEFLPVIPVGLLAGVLADVRDRLRIVQWAQCAVAALTVCLIATTEAGSPIAGLLGLAFAMAVAATFERPASAALLPRLVPEALFAPAVTLTGSVRNSAWALGPLVAGLVIAQAGVAAAYATAAALLVASIGLLVGIPAPGAATAAGEPINADTIRAGLRFVREEQAILGAMTLDLFAVLFASVAGILPIFAADVLDVGPRGYGLLSAALTIGTFLMAGVLLARPGIERPGRALLAAVAVFGLATLVFSLSTSFVVSVGALIVAGMADEVSMVTRETIIQLSTPDEMRGRVSAVNFIFIGASNELGAAESGVLAGLTSARFSAAFGSVVCLLAFAWIGWRMPALRTVNPARRREDGSGQASGV